MNTSTFIADHISKKLADSFRVIQGTEWVKVVTPFLDKRRDNIQLYVREEQDGWKVTDDGFFLDDLEMTFGSVPELVARAFNIVNSAGLSFKGHQMEITSESDEIFESIMEAVSIAYRIMAIEPIKYPVHPIRFVSAVEKAIVDAGLPWRPHVTFPGRSGYQHQFNFEVTTSKRGTSLLRVVNNAGAKASFESYLLALTDIRAENAGIPVSMVAHQDTRSADQKRVVERQQGVVLSVADLVPALNTPYEESLQYGLTTGSNLQPSLAWPSGFLE
jgi:hypothetical protein